MISLTWRRRIAEIAASILTLGGMAIGSSTQVGNDFYLLSSIFWWYLMFSREMWGMLPFNIVMTVIEVWHLFVL